MMDDKYNTAREAEYTEIDESERHTKNIPATLADVAVIRHPLMKDKDAKGLKEIQDELAVDRELGLKYQAADTASQALKNDIDELTASRDFFEVSKRMLYKLFHITDLRIKCLPQNITSVFSTIQETAPWAFLTPLSLLLSYPFLLWMSWLVNAKMAQPATIFNIILAICLGVSVVAMFFTGLGSLFNSKKYEFNYLQIKLKLTPLSQVDTKIPYGAKLKVLEAQRTKIFNDFVMAYPEFHTAHKEVKTPSFRIDPAILGVTADKRMFMIVYWDIKRDVEKVIKDIKMFHKFKLQKL